MKFFSLLLFLTSCTQLAGIKPSQADRFVNSMSEQSQAPDDTQGDDPSLESGVSPMVQVTEFDEEYITPLIEKMESLDKKGYPYIVVRINSYGGSIHWGMELIQAMEGLNTKTICIVDWKAMSMGAYLLESGACDVRLMTKRSVILFHEPLVNQAQGNAHELQGIIDQLKALTESLVTTASERLGMSEDDFRAKIDNKAWTMSYREALDSGVVDGIISPLVLPPLVKVKPLQNVLRF